ncbi:MAG: restriction endonuclease [Candidatus Schmidhempelia sp.]|nr:restriction endonuclease [Candidatus Schmidhempelia sp.]
MTNKIITPLFPTYAKTAAMMKAVSGYTKKAVHSMINEIVEQSGTPQNPVDWSDPDSWIKERLQGESAEIASKIWQQDKHILNPRHSYGTYMFLNNGALMTTNSQGFWQPSLKGQAFLKGDKMVWRELDDAEAILQLLELLNTRRQAKNSDLLPEWITYLRQHSKWNSERACKSTLYARLVNLVERKLVKRDGITYQITENGKKWLEAIPEEKLRDPLDEIMDSVVRYNEQQKALLAAHLHKMNPYHFEILISQLLQAMGYEDVNVTKASGDKGIDVIGNVQVGITRITEVVQVKRIQNSINRPIIDQLRGALPYHKAIRGTLITTSKFSSGCAEAANYPGAAPITLIDGARLIELLIENGVGIKRNNSLELLSIDLSVFDEQLTD